MATKKVGTLIKEARTAAGLTQEQLARKVTGVSAADVGKVERGEADFTQAQLKLIAKALGVTQASLLNAPKNVSGTAKKTSSTTAAKKTSSTTTAKKTSSTTTAAAKKTAAPKTPANANSTMKVTATERKLVETYRAATSAQKKAAGRVLKGECDELLDQINNTNSGLADTITDFLGNLLGGGK